MLNDVFDEILNQMLDPVTPNKPFDNDLFNTRLNHYYVLLDRASIQEIVALLKGKIFMTSPNENWNFIPIELVLSTYKQLFSKLEMPEILSQFASYLSFVSDMNEDISSDIFKLIKFIKS